MFNLSIWNGNFLSAHAYHVVRDSKVSVLAVMKESLHVLLYFYF